jgi:ATP-dependent DNA helicase RecG
MGITTEVNLKQENKLDYIEIIVQPYSVPISLHGQYYYRSGSVKQELTGIALNEFLLKKAGQTWDNVIEEEASFNDIDEATVKKYLRKAEEAGRLPDIDGLSTPELLDKLHLTKNGKLKRAAIVLFGKAPGKFYPNTFVKIGKFDDDDFTIRFQEVEDGNIIQVLDKVLRTLDYKFLIKNISFVSRNESC